MDLDTAMEEFERTRQIGPLADSFPFTPGMEAPSRPALTSPDDGTTDLSTAGTDATQESRVNMTPPKRWRLVRMPEALALRLERLAGEMERAYAEGRVDVPTAMCEAIPMWFVVQNALDEQEARRERSRRPRAKK